MCDELLLLYVCGRHEEAIEGQKDTFLMPAIPCGVVSWEGRIRDRDCIIT